MQRWRYSLHLHVAFKLITIRGWQPFTSLHILESVQFSRYQSVHNRFGTQLEKKKKNEGVGNSSLTACGLAGERPLSPEKKDS